MIVTRIHCHALDLAWPVLQPLLAPAIGRSPDRPDVPTSVCEGTAELWAIAESATPIAAVVTRITLLPERRCLVWLVGGARLDDWADSFVARIEAFARAWGCVAIWGVGRPGWSRLAHRLGAARIDDIDGQYAWQRRLA